MANKWHSYGAAGNYDELYEQLAPELPPEKLKPSKPNGVSIWVTIAVWIFTLFISVGISFLIFCFDSEEKGITVDIWCAMKDSSILKDIGLVLFVELATYLFGLYKQKGCRLDIKDSQFLLYIVSLVLAICDTFFSVKFATVVNETPFKLTLWLVFVICSFLVCVLEQIEIPKRKGE